MKISKEISALFTLMDDPDEEIYSTVSDKIISFGKEIIPNLENLWENTYDENIQIRIEAIIHKLHFKDLYEEFRLWKENEGDLLNGAILCAKYRYPEMSPVLVSQEIEKLRKNIWLELNNYLTPLEEINIISSILYNYYKLKGTEIDYLQPENFLISSTLDSKNGNVISNGIIYLSLCELLDIPITAVNIPKQFLLAYFDTKIDFVNPAGKDSEKILFFIDPVNGQIYSHKDIENYFTRISVTPSEPHFNKKNNIQIIQFLLREFSKCFDGTPKKVAEIQTIIDLLEE